MSNLYGNNGLDNYNTWYDDNGGGFKGSGDYSSFWDPIVSGIENGDGNIPGLTAGNTTQYYDYSNLSGSGVFITTNNDGVTTYAAREDYNLIGGVRETAYSFLPGRGVSRMKRYRVLFNVV